jgi:hypothetical protein
MNFLFFVMLMLLSSCFLRLGEPLSSLAIEGAYWMIIYINFENIYKKKLTLFLIYALKLRRNSRAICKSFRQWTRKVSNSPNSGLLLVNNCTQSACQWSFDRNWTDQISVAYFNFKKIKIKTPCLKFGQSRSNSHRQLISFILYTYCFILMLVLPLICVNFRYRATMKAE